MCLGSDIFYFSWLVQVCKMRIKVKIDNKEEIERQIEELTEEYNAISKIEHPLQHFLLEIVDELKETKEVVENRGEEHYRVSYWSEFSDIVKNKVSVLKD